MKINIDLPVGVTYPSLSSIPFPEGMLNGVQLFFNWHLFENGLPIHSHKEIIAQWPDESIKWLHVHAIFTGGNHYYFEHFSSIISWPLLPEIPTDDTMDWELLVEEARNQIWKNTPLDRSTLELVPTDAYSLNIIDNKGGWIYTKPDGTVHDETKFLEVDSLFMRVTRYEGWLKSAAGVRSIFRYRTRITRYATDKRVIISNEIVFSGTMRNRKIKQISFVLTSIPNAQKVSYGADGLTQSAILTNPGENATIHQRRPGKCEVIIPDGQLFFQKSDGYISRKGITLLARNFWQKFPQALRAEPGNLVYRQWYGKGEEYTREERLDDHNLHQVLHWHQGVFLENNIPKTGDPANPEWADKFYGLLPKEEGGLDEYIEYTDFADMQGITIHDEIAIHFGPIDFNVVSAIWNKNPVGFCDGTYIESTVVSDFGAKSSDFEAQEQFMEDSILSYTNPDRFQDYGRFIYGDSHRNILVYFNRPSLHRLWLASYYSAGETYWRMRLRGGSEDILQLARRNTERYRSIVQTSYDQLNRLGRPGEPEIQGHNPGGFWYRGLWWGNNYGQNKGHAGWNTRNGRIPDPDSLLWSWILDGNRYHKDGYELWHKYAKFGIRLRGLNTTDSVREANNALTYGINSFLYYVKHPIPGFRLTDSDAETIINNLTEIGNALLKTWLRSDTDGPLMQPDWIRVFVQFLIQFYDPAVGDEEKEQFIARVLHFAVSNYNSNFYSDQKTLDLATLLIDIYQGKYPFYYNYYPKKLSLDDIRISDHLVWISKIMDNVYQGPDERWRNFGVGDGELGDHFLKLQWGAFVKRIRSLNISGTNIESYDFHGHYPTSEHSRAPHHPYSMKTCYGNEFLLLNTNSQPTDNPPPLKMEPIEFFFKIPPEGLGISGSTEREIWIVSPSKHLENIANKGLVDFIVIANKFISITSNTNITENNYPDGRTGRSNTTLSHYTSGSDHSFDSFSPPHHVNLKERVCSWERGISIRSTSGTELYTAYDKIETPTNETGVYRVFIAGPGIIPGMTVVGLPEAMLLTPDAVSFANTSPDRNFVLNDNAHRKYRLSDSCLYYKNIEDRVVLLQCWASVIEPLETTSGKRRFGSFVRVKIPGSSRDLQFEGLGYGDPNESDIVKISLAPQEIVRIKTVIVYPADDVVRMHINGRVLCSRNMGDLLSFTPYEEEIRNGSYELLV